MRLEFKAQITVFLSVIFSVLLSLVGAMVECTSISLAKSMNQADLILAMESVFAEYHPQLLRNYDIFAKEGSELSSISRRLVYYGANDLKHDVVKMELLSDHHGQEFYRQAVESMGGTVKELDVTIENPFEDQQAEVQEKIEILEEETGQEIPEFNAIGSSHILALVLPKENTISSRRIESNELPSQRQLQQGEGSQSEVEKTVSGKWLFSTYLEEHFLHYLNQEHTNPLSYEMEYLLAGKETDEENLEWVAKKLLSIRIGINYAYLLTDETKLAETETVATGICTLLAVPEATELVKQAMLFFWSYGESVMDLRALYRGKKIPLVKSKETWQLQISNLIQGGVNEGMAMEGEGENGITYKEYLKALLVATNTDTLCMRALDLIEVNLGIQVDNCVTKLELKSKGTTWREVKYTCNTKFAYE